MPRTAPIASTAQHRTFFESGLPFRCLAGPTADPPLQPCAPPAPPQAAPAAAPPPPCAAQRRRRRHPAQQRHTYSRTEVVSCTQPFRTLSCALHAAVNTGRRELQAQHTQRSALLCELPTLRRLATPKQPHRPTSAAVRAARSAASASCSAASRASCSAASRACSCATSSSGAAAAAEVAAYTTEWSTRPEGPWDAVVAGQLPNAMTPEMQLENAKQAGTQHLITNPASLPALPPTAPPHPPALRRP